MTLRQIERRVSALEKQVRTLTPPENSNSGPWYRSHAGRFANDPIFEEILKLGRAYRQSQRPARQARKG